MMRMSGFDRRRCVLLVMAIAILVALPSIRNGFVYDDVWVIERNAAVHDVGAVGTLLQAPYWPGGVMWRPVALAGYALQWAIGDGSPLIFHASSILLYGLVCGLVALLGAQLFGLSVGVIAGTLFAVHPVHVEVTANSIGQAELVAALGYLLALLAGVARSRSENTPRRTVLLSLGLVAFALGLGAKEHVVTFPAALMVVWWVVGRERAKSFGVMARREWPFLLGCLVLIATFLVFRAQYAVSVTNAGGIAAGLEQHSILGRAIVMLPVSLKWLMLLFAPFRLSGDYSIQHLVPEPEFGLTHVAALLVWGALAFIMWRHREDSPGLFVGGVLFVVLISVASNVVIPLEILLAERLLFLPSVGWSFAVAGTVAAVITRRPAGGSRPVWIGVAVVAVIFAARSAERATIWHSNDRFFQQLLRDAPNSYRGHWASGSYAFQRGDSALGEKEFKAAIGLNPDRADLLEDLGRIYAASGRYEPAITVLRRAVELDPALMQSSIALAVSLARTGRAPQGVEVLDAAVEIHGEEPGLLLAQGEVLKRAEQPLSALLALDRMIEREPGLWRVHVMAAEAAALAGHCDEAWARLDSAMTRVPESGRADVEALRSWVANGNAPCK